MREKDILMMLSSELLFMRITVNQVKQASHAHTHPKTHTHTIHMQTHSVLVVLFIKILKPNVCVCMNYHEVVTAATPSLPPTSCTLPHPLLHTHTHTHTHTHVYTHHPRHYQGNQFEQTES